MYCKYSIALCFIIACSQQVVHGATQTNVTTKRSFELNHNKDQFLKDGQPFRYVSGEIHYFRIPRPYWRDRLRKYRAAGLNAIQIYVEWMYHEPQPRQYRFTGQYDVEHFIRLAIQEHLLVIFRPGPYICAERDMGGLPYWLITQHPHISLRTTNKDYQKEVTTWFSVLMPRMKKFFYGQGGPIILVQVENEYGFLNNCDMKYKLWMSDLIRSYVKNDAQLFTLDRTIDYVKGCGLIPGVLGTVDFGIETNPLRAQRIIKSRANGGPFVNSEFYTGWLSFWGNPPDQKNISKVLFYSKEMLDLGWSFSYYMFHGGTNFGFTNGASELGGRYLADITSYDYDAPINEAGDPTPKYYAIRQLISKYLPLPNLPIPLPSPKGSYGKVLLHPLSKVFNSTKFHMKTTYAERPKTFEELNQFSGYVLYETKIPAHASNESLFCAFFVRDRAHVFLNYNFVGLMSRSENVFTIPLKSSAGKTLTLLVENQGRISFGPHIKDRKGLLRAPTLNAAPLLGWKMQQLPLDSRPRFARFPSFVPRIPPPAFYSGDFILNGPVRDTFVNLKGWGKGVVFINNVNIGRYWPSVGPQTTLYVPGCFLRPFPMKNTITLFETDHVRAFPQVEFVKKHVLHEVPHWLDFVP